MSAPGKLVLASVLLVACGATMQQIVRNVLTDTQIACVFASELTDAQEVLTACQIAQDLAPLVRKLVAQREAAKRVGVHWDAPADAGGQ